MIIGIDLINELFATINYINEVDFKNLNANKSIKIESTCIDKTHINVRILEI